MSGDLLSEGTLAVMEERRAKPKDRGPYPCHGGCGRSLRPYRRTVRQFPGTMMEYSENRCRGCWYAMMSERHPEDPAYAVLTCPGCGCSTRPYRCPEDALPGTRRRQGEDKLTCHPCSKGPAAKEASEQELRANLDRFLNRIRGTSRKVRNPYSPN
jgi:hypothetical protein